MMASKKIKEWEIEAVLENIEKGITTMEKVEANNPKLASAIKRFQTKVAKERAAVVPYTLGFWDKNGSRRIYVNGGRLATMRGNKVWIEESDNELGFVIKERGDWYSYGASFAQGGEKPWEAIAREALDAHGMSLSELNFDDLMAHAK